MLTFKTDISILTFDGHQTLEITMLENNELNIFKVRQIFEQSRSISSNKKLNIILDLRGLQFCHIPSEVMDYMAKSIFTKYQRAVALIIEGLGQKMIGSFYIKIVKPEVETKVFTNKSDAINWLKTLNEKETTPTL